VLWADAGIAPDEIWGELRRREGVSGIAEKKSRPKS
jgi:phosphoribosyl-ATP pyrophosphohydrolase